MVREDGERMHLDIRAAQSEHENADHQLIEELAGSQEEAALHAATAEVDQGMRRDVAYLFRHLTQLDAQGLDRRSL